MLLDPDPAASRGFSLAWLLGSAAPPSTVELPHAGCQQHTTHPSKERIRKRFGLRHDRQVHRPGGGKGDVARSVAAR